MTYVVASRSQRRKRIEERREDLYLEVVHIWRQLKSYFAELSAADDKDSVKWDGGAFDDLTLTFSKVSVFGSREMSSLVEAARLGAVEMFEHQTQKDWAALDTKYPAFQASVEAVQRQARTEIGSRKKKRWSLPWSRKPAESE